MKIIVDTNLLIDFSRQKKKTEDILWLKLVGYAKREGHQLIFPTAALFEYYCGEEMEREKNRGIAIDILTDTVLLDLNEETAREAARLFRKYKLSIGVVDYILAATTITLKGELVTLNVKHFLPIKELKMFDFSKLE